MKKLTDEDIEAIARRTAQLVVQMLSVPKTPAQRASGSGRQAKIEVDKLDDDQKRLLYLRNTYCERNNSQLARVLKREASYVGRLFYPRERKGSKGIGLTIMRACVVQFGLSPTFWNEPPPALE